MVKVSQKSMKRGKSDDRALHTVRVPYLWTEKNMNGRWIDWWVGDGQSEKILNISNFTVLPRSRWGVTFDCYIAFCYNLCCTFPSMSEENKSIMSPNHCLWKAEDIFCSAPFRLCFRLMRGFKTSWKVPTLKAAFCFAHLT